MTGRPGGVDCVFVPPDVLLSDPTFAPRLRQQCPGAALVLLQGNAQLAGVLRADDFVPGPTPAAPLHPEDLSMVIMRCQTGRTTFGSTSSTISSLASWGSPTPQQPGTASGALGAAQAHASPIAHRAAMSLGMQSAAGTAAAGGVLHAAQATSPRGMTQHPGNSGGGGGTGDMSNLHAQIAQLQAQLQQKQQALHPTGSGSSGGGAAQSPTARMLGAGPGTPEIQPAAGTAAMPRPPPLRLADAGIIPADAQPGTAASGASADSAATWPGIGSGVTAGGLRYGQSSAPGAASATVTPRSHMHGASGGSGGGSTGAPGSPLVTDMMAQIAELRRKLGERPRAASGSVQASPEQAWLGSEATSGLGGSRTTPGGMSASPQPAVAAVAAAAAAGYGGSGSGERPSPFTQQLPGMLSAGQHQHQQTAGVANSGSSPGQFPTGGSNGVALRALGVDRVGLRNIGSMLRPGQGGTPPVGALGGGLGARTGLMQAALQQSSPQSPQPQHLLPAFQRQPPAASSPFQQQPQQGPTDQLSILKQQVQQLQHLQQQQLANSAAASPRSPVPAVNSPLHSSRGAPGTALTAPGGGLDSPRMASPTGTASAAADSSVSSRANSFVAPSGSRYRPPSRPRAPSPLSGGAAGTAGHQSDGPRPSRFATPPYRRGGDADGSSGVGGYSSDTGGSLSGRSGTPGDSGGKTRAAPAMSGDAAIAAALDAAEEEASQTEAPVLRHGASHGTGGGGADAAQLAGALERLAQSMELGADGEGGGGGGYEPSEVEASLAPDNDSGAGGRGSGSGAGGASGSGPYRRSSAGEHSSVDLFPQSPRNMGAPQQAALTAMSSAKPQQEAAVQGLDSGQGQHTASPGRVNSNLGATGRVSHTVRMSAASMASMDASDTEASAKPGAARHRQTPATLHELQVLEDIGERIIGSASVHRPGAGMSADASVNHQADDLVLLSSPAGSPPADGRGGGPGAAETSLAPSRQGSGRGAQSGGAATAAGRSAAGGSDAGSVGSRLAEALRRHEAMAATAANGGRDTAGGGRGVLEASFAMEDEGSQGGRTGAARGAPSRGSSGRSALAATARAAAAASSDIDLSPRRALPPPRGQPHSASPAAAEDEPLMAGLARRPAASAPAPYSTSSASAAGPGSAGSAWALPPRPSTPPARRRARILLGSHPIVITRDDFLAQ